MKVVFFDIDGTLVETGGAGVRAFADVFADEFSVAEIDRGVSFAGRSDRGIAADLFVRHGLGDTPENWARFKRSYLRRLPERLASSSGRVLPGALGLIDRLDAMRDVHVGLLTGNVREAAELKLSHYRLWERFHRSDLAVLGGFGDEHTDRNDIAAAAAAAARRRHAERPLTAPGSPERVAVIGDTPNDIRCARAIGAYAVAVPTGHVSAEVLAAAGPDLLATTLEDAGGLLAWIAS